MQKAKERRAQQLEQQKLKAATPSGEKDGPGSEKNKGDGRSNGTIAPGAPPPEHGLTDPMFNYAVSASEPRQDDMLSEYYLRATEASTF